MRKILFGVLLSALLLTAVPAQAVAINSRGQVTGCVAGGVAHIGGKVVALPAGGCNWVDDDTIVYQVCDGATCVVQTFNQVTGIKTTGFNGGAIDITGGGGIWACHCGVGVQVSNGQAYPGAALTMNQSFEDGTFVMKTVYQSWGPYEAVEPSGARWKITDAGVGIIASDFQLLGARRVTWLEGRPRNNFGADIKWLGGWWLRSAFIEGKLWVMYQNSQTGRLFLHPADSFQGYVIGPDTLTFEPAIRVLPGGDVAVAWSTDPSESPNGTKVVRVHMNGPRVDLAEFAKPAPVVVVPPPPPPPPPIDTLQGGNQKAVVVAVIKAHPEVDSCDELSLDKGRALLVDWAAQRLNKSAGKVVWGRKSRGEPKNGIADRPNTDALTFLRDDGKFEIYDVVSGTPPCGATWDGDTAFSPGQNGFWAPPQLRAEGTIPVPPVDPKIAELERKLVEVEILLAQASVDRDGARQRVGELEAERDDLKQQLTTAREERDQARQERDAAVNAPHTCEAKVPGFLRALGVRVGCVVK